MNNLPELPTPLTDVAVAGPHDGELRPALEEYYDAEQMRAYAIAALTAQQTVGGADRALKDALFACTAEGRKAGRYSGVMYDGGFARVDFTVERTATPPSAQAAGGAVAWYVFADTEHWVTLDRSEADDNREQGCQVRPLVFGDLQ